MSHVDICPDCGHERKCVVGQYFQCPVCDIFELRGNEPELGGIDLGEQWEETTPVSGPYIDPFADSDTFLAVSPSTGAFVLDVPTSYSFYSFDESYVRSLRDALAALYAKDLAAKNGEIERLMKEIEKPLLKPVKPE